jgi:hypothetical protein
VDFIAGEPRLQWRREPARKGERTMRAYVFFSVHEALFQPMAEQLAARGVNAWSGFVWSRHQAKAITGHGIQWDPLLVFTRDLLPSCDDGREPDLDWLRQRERDLGVSIQRMLAAERHLLAGRTFTQIMRMAEVALREIAAAYDRARPDFVFSEDVSCFHSYVHFVLAQERKIPFWSIGSGRLPNRIAVYASGFQRLERFERLVAEIQSRGLLDAERAAASEYVKTFRDRPVRPPGMGTRARKPRVELSDVRRIADAASKFFGDRDNPTAIGPLRAVRSRLTRIARVAVADAKGVFEPPVPGERFVLFPLHFQPEATTLVQAPLYVDQLALLRDLAASLPVGHRLYVKEHVSSRGRRPLEFYNAIRAIPAARLLGPDEDTWALIRAAAVVAVITGTVGWEALMFEKPVVTFGDIFFNIHPSVYRAANVAKDGWFELFSRATTEHRHDPEAVLIMIAALQQSTYPGFIASPSTFRETLEPSNVALLVDALADTLGLPPT